MNESVCSTRHGHESGRVLIINRFIPDLLKMAIWCKNQEPSHKVHYNTASWGSCLYLYPSLPLCPWARHSKLNGAQQIPPICVLMYVLMGEVNANMLSALCYCDCAMYPTIHFFFFFDVASQWPNHLQNCSSCFFLYSCIHLIIWKILKTLPETHFLAVSR